MRLDQYVADQHPGLSRSYVAKLIDDGQVLVNKAPGKRGYRLRSGDKIKMNFDISKLEQIEDIDLPILYEDDDVLVVNKPAGVISHSRGKYWNEPSVASFVRQKTGQDGDRAGIVHRLDRATSGVMICAKNAPALTFLQKQFSQRKVKKTYLAIVEGKPARKEAVIDMPIGRNPKAPATFKADIGGKPAQTSYKVVGTADGCSLLELTPLTGRTHQLRVHLKQIGHPIVGDTLYGGKPAERLLLHARSLTITLPYMTRHTFEAPTPAIFKEVMR